MKKKKTTLPYWGEKKKLVIIHTAIGKCVSDSRSSNLKAS